MSSTAWGYTTTTGPHTWGDNFPSANGARQSPIDINTNEIIQDRELSNRALQINYDSTHADKLENTGHGFKISMKKGSKSEIQGGPLTNTYQLEQFHFHWGTSDLNGSEHTVDGAAFASEVHLVHWNTKYSSFQAALDKSDGLCVLGTFFKVGKHHPEIQKLLDQFSAIGFKGNSVNLDGFNCNTLLPANKAYWTYPGSLTTPPCNECVVWVVFEDPLEMSAQQLDAFRQLNNHGTDEEKPSDEFGGRILVNCRPPLDCGSRIVKYAE